MRTLIAIIFAVTLILAPISTFAGEQDSSDKFHAAVDKIVQMIEREQNIVCPNQVDTSKMLCNLEFLHLKQKARSIGLYASMAGIAAISEGKGAAKKQADMAQKTLSELPDDFKKLVEKWQKK